MFSLQFKRLCWKHGMSMSRTCKTPVLYFPIVQHWQPMAQGIIMISGSSFATIITITIMITMIIKMGDSLLSMLCLLSTLCLLVILSTPATLDVDHYHGHLVDHLRLPSSSSVSNHSGFWRHISCGSWVHSIHTSGPAWTSQTTSRRKSCKGDEFISFFRVRAIAIAKKCHKKRHF